MASSSSAAAAVAANRAFLTRACAPNQTPVGVRSGLCANCPPAYPNVAAAQAAADADAQTRYQNETDPNNADRPYCGNNAIIKKWTLYAQCHATAQPTFQNPFYYPGVGTSNECFTIGRNVGMLVGRSSASALNAPGAPPPAAPGARGGYRGRGRGGPAGGGGRGRGRGRGGPAGARGRGRGRGRGGAAALSAAAAPSDEEEEKTESDEEESEEEEEEEAPPPVRRSSRQVRGRQR
jgi:hypothetical protein